MRSHRVDQHTQRKRVAKVGVVVLPQVHLRRLVGCFATGPVPAFAREGRLGKIDQLHLRAAARAPVQHDVLQREVAVGHAKVVEPADGTEELPCDRLHPRLLLPAGAQGLLAPREEVAAGREGRDEVGAHAVPEDAQELAHVAVAQAVEVELEPGAEPRGLHGLGVARPEVLRPGPRPGDRQSLHRDHVALLHRFPDLNATEVRLGSHRLVDLFESPFGPWGRFAHLADASRHLLRLRGRLRRRPGSLKAGVLLVVGGDAGAVPGGGVRQRVQRVRGQARERVGGLALAHDRVEAPYLHGRERDARQLVEGGHVLPGGSG
mmetsp:Transcript_52040/g.161097  ORF Transcript_52040/g.161097 Transcript_52040/m.161097 type:complete len:320 (+) Transcript_52040:397-1356(+)